VIRVYDAAGNVVEAHEHKDDFKGWGVCKFAKNLTALLPSITQANASDHSSVTREFRLR
jgi:hypothetical protein